MQLRVLPCGDRGLLVECSELDEVLALHAALSQAPPSGVVDMVPAARTLLLRTAQGTDLASLERAVRRCRPRYGGTPDRGLVRIPVEYSGEDLSEVARLTGLAEREVVRAHTTVEWSVAFCGFAPGFGYLISAAKRLHVPRRQSPRTVVPAGSVGLAGSYTGVYPKRAPGGWQLIGHTELTTWDVDADPPALLRPGVRVRFDES